MGAIYKANKKKTDFCPIGAEDALDDGTIICDPTGEYAALTEALGGEAIRPVTKDKKNGRGNKQDGER